MIGENPLDRKVFQDELDFKTLENILETLDHVTPKKVSRQEFNNLKGNFLVETGEDKFGKSYDLFLPDDLVYGELLHLIDFLSKRFGIENYTPYDRILTQTKIMVGVVLRGLGNEEGEKELRSLASKYNISDEFIKRILGQKISFGETRNTLRRVKYNGKTGSKEESLTLGFEELKDLFGEEFDLTFFRKGVNMLRLGMMTITRAEQESIKKGRIDDISVRFKVNDIDLDKSEKFLRDTIGIEELKKEIELARTLGNQEEINNIEMKAVSKILKELYKYPYVRTSNESGYKPNKIRKTKEVYCVGFSILGHAFLNELGIKHYGLGLPSHSAISIHIGGKEYFFDPTRSEKLYMISFGENLGEYMKFEIDDEFFANSPEGSIRFDLKCVKGDPEKIILSQIYGNLSWELYHYRGIILLGKAINLNPSNPNLYFSKGIALAELGKTKLSILYNYINYLLGEKNQKYIWPINKLGLRIGISYLQYIIENSNVFSGLLYKKEKAKIKQLIDSQDFKGLRLYLLELEQEDN